MRESNQKSVENFVEDLGEIAALWGEFIITFTVVETKFLRNRLSIRPGYEREEIVKKRQTVRDMGRLVLKNTLETFKNYL